MVNTFTQFLCALGLMVSLVAAPLSRAEQVEVADPNAAPVDVDAKAKEEAEAKAKEAAKLAEAKVIKEKEAAEAKAKADAEAKAAKEKEATETAKQTTNPVEESLRLHLLDGSMLSGRFTLQVLAVETDYGLLNVPLNSVKSITPGLKSHPGLAKQITGWIADLGSSNIKERENAYQMLYKQGPAVVKELEKFQQDSDTERKSKVLQLLKEFEEQLESDSPLMRSNEWQTLQEKDAVETTDFTIVGRIVPQTFEFWSQYGTLNVQLADIRRAQRLTTKKEDVRLTLTVGAANFANKKPMTTVIRVERGDQIFITADGTMQMQPWGAGASSTPEGNQNYGWFTGNTIPTGAHWSAVSTATNSGSKWGINLSRKSRRAAPCNSPSGCRMITTKTNSPAIIR